jgi:hypothetical protein
MSGYEPTPGSLDETSWREVEKYLHDNQKRYSIYLLIVSLTRLVIITFLFMGFIHVVPRFDQFVIGALLYAYLVLEGLTLWMRKKHVNLYRYK